MISSKMAIIGSSPLARGLRDRQRTGGADRGIIPARAGFTPTGRRPPRTETDHPRSRGVYRCISVRNVPPMGSSPLARGLRVRGPGQRLLVRIIPARAGFTRPWRSSTKACMDHPRSRGVYRYERQSVADNGGSSPLARGLRRKNVCVPTQKRIIPARAGFTGTRETRATRSEDHPRLRGVYSRATHSVAGSPGSSPLARGLPKPGSPIARVFGIIPARAGFTPASARPTRRSLDHPRSRGVYVCDVVAGPELGRIIPARAGFTA